MSENVNDESFSMPETSDRSYINITSTDMEYFNSTIKYSDLWPTLIIIGVILTHTRKYGL